MCYGTRGGLERKTANRGSSSLMPVTGLSFFPCRVYSGPVPPKISVGKCESEARASGGCYVYFVCTVLYTTVHCTVVYRAGGGLLRRWKCCHQSTTHMVPMAGPRWGARGSTWEGTNTINMKLFHAMKESERLILILNETEQTREILFLSPSLDLAAQS